jgi:hypothetical protein
MSFNFKVVFAAALLAGSPVIAGQNNVSPNSPNGNPIQIKIFYGPVETGKWLVQGNAYLDHRINVCVASTQFDDGSWIELVRNLDKGAQVYITIMNTGWNIRKPSPEFGNVFTAKIRSSSYDSGLTADKTASGMFLNFKTVVFPNLYADSVKEMITGANQMVFLMPGRIQNVMVEFDTDEGQLILDNIGECVKKAYTKNVEPDRRRESL